MKYYAFGLLVLLLAVPALADIGHDITLPVVGRLFQPNIQYTTELVIRNHRDVPQFVILEFIGSRLPTNPRFPYHGVMLLAPRETFFDPSGRIPNTTSSRVFAMRLWAARPTGKTNDAGHELYEPDPDGRIEALAYIIGARGRFGAYGTSRQEIQATASSDYHAREAVFQGIRHDGFAYTNVGITNMDDRRLEVFIIEFANEDPVEVAVPPQTLVSVRLPGDGKADRFVKVTPKWARNGEERTTPWVAYASTIDIQTGDAYTGIRALAMEAVQP